MVSPAEEAAKQERSGKSSLHYTLFTESMRAASLSFGGGMVFLPLLQKSIVEQRQLLSMEDFLDCVAIASSGPGAIIVNLSTAVGYRLGGVTGVISATTGALLPTLVMVLLVAFFLGSYLDAPLAEKAYAAIRPAVAGLVLALWAEIASVVLRRHILGWSLFAGGVIGLLFLKIHPLAVILLSALLGYFLQAGKTRRHKG